MPGVTALCYDTSMAQGWPLTEQLQTSEGISAATAGAVRYFQVLPTPGEPCPACGRKVPMSGAERQRRYRERRAELKEKHPGEWAAFQGAH